MQLKKTSQSVSSGGSSSPTFGQANMQNRKAWPKTLQLQVQINPQFSNTSDPISLWVGGGGGGAGEVTFYGASIVRKWQL